MKFKIKKLLTDRQLLKVKFSMFMGFLLFCYIMTANYFVQGQDENLQYNADEDYKDFRSTKTDMYERGKIVYYSMNSEVCDR